MGAFSANAGDAYPGSADAHGGSPDAGTFGYGGCPERPARHARGRGARHRCRGHAHSCSSCVRFPQGTLARRCRVAPIILGVEVPEMCSYTLRYLHLAGGHPGPRPTQ